MRIKNNEDFIKLVKDLKEIVEKFKHYYHNLYIKDWILFQTKLLNIGHLIGIHYIRRIYKYSNKLNDVECIWRFINEVLSNKINLYKFQNRCMNNFNAIPDLNKIL